MKLRAKMLLVFAATFAGGMLLLYFVSRSMLLSSFRELENAQNPRYKAVLSKALADLDAQLLTFAN